MWRGFCSSSSIDKTDESGLLKAYAERSAVRLYEMHMYRLDQSKFQRGISKTRIARLQSGLSAILHRGLHYYSTKLDLHSNLRSATMATSWVISQSRPSASRLLALLPHLFVGGVREAHTSASNTTSKISRFYKAAHVVPAEDRVRREYRACAFGLPTFPILCE